jgi:hypothetical protein
MKTQAMAKARTQQRAPQRISRVVESNKLPKNSAKPGSRRSDSSKTLVKGLGRKQTSDEATAALMVEGLGTNAVTAAGFSKMLGELDLTQCMRALMAETRRVQNGNLGGLEAILAAQAVSLNAIFTQLAYETSKMTIVDQIDRFTRLALKAQTQCRATCESLAVIKNPPVFARQANITHGPQQVNNGVPLVRAENQQPEPNKLLEMHDERLDNKAKGASGAGDQALAAVGAFHRPTNSRRQGPIRSECRPRRTAAAMARDE